MLPVTCQCNSHQQADRLGEAVTLPVAGSRQLPVLSYSHSQTPISPSTNIVHGRRNWPERCAKRANMGQQRTCLLELVCVAAAAACMRAPSAQSRSQHQRLLDLPSLTASQAVLAECLS
jgi:hypothetical protein